MKTIIMQKIIKSLTCGLLAIPVLTACMTLESISIEYQVPASVSFPSQLRRIGVVNNMPPAVMAHTSDDPLSAAIDTIYAVGHGTLAGEALAQSVANERYFDEVVLSDSALYHPQRIRPAEQPASLSPQEADLLMQSMDVDFLVVLDEVRIEAVRRHIYLTGLQTYLGTVDAKVQPTLRIYLPGRKAPMVSISPVDSIYWEEIGQNESYVRSHLIDANEVIRQASEFAGEILVKHLLPGWENAGRQYVAGGSVNMRDASVYVRESNWQEAVRLWEKEYNTAKNKRKFFAAYNLALGYEMMGQLHTAADWAEKAKQLASIIDKVEATPLSRMSTADFPHYRYASLRSQQLNSRLSKLSVLEAQLERLKENPEP